MVTSLGFVLITATKQNERQ